MAGKRQVQIPAVAETGREARENGHKRLELDYPSFVQILESLRLTGGLEQGPRIEEVAAELRLGSVRASKYQLAVLPNDRNDLIYELLYRLEALGVFPWPIDKQAVADGWIHLIEDPRQRAGLDAMISAGNPPWVRPVYQVVTSEALPDSNIPGDITKKGKKTRKKKAPR